MPFFDEIARQSDQLIHFKSVSTGEQVSFPAFINQFSDNYAVSWGAGPQIFGRTDPIKNYQTTSRRIQATFDILGRNRQIALENFQKYSKLIKMLYPVYEDPRPGGNNSRIIKSAPLIRIRYSNYIRSEANPDGLLGCLQGVTFAPDFAGGHFITQKNELIPVKYNMSLQFEPLHERPLGFDKNGEFLNKTFPYNQERMSVSRNPSTPGSAAVVTGR